MISPHYSLLKCNNFIKYPYYDEKSTEHKHGIEPIQWKQECMHSDHITELFFFLSNHANKMAFGNQLKNLESLLCACQAQLRISHASLCMRLEESLGRKMDYSQHWRKQ